MSEARVEAAAAGRACWRASVSAACFCSWRVMSCLWWFAAISFDCCACPSWKRSSCTCRLSCKRFACSTAGKQRLTRHAYPDRGPVTGLWPSHVSHSDHMRVKLPPAEC